MEEYFDILCKSAVFEGADKNTVRQILQACGYKLKAFKKDEVILMRAQAFESIGIVVSGRLCAQKNTAAGRSFIVTNMREGAVFGDILAGSHALSPVTITAQAESRVLLLPLKALMKNVGRINGAYIILQNLIGAISDKYFALDKRLDLLLEKSLRTRIYAYLQEKAAPKGSFYHKQTRQQLADYLGCERAALSRELSRMKREGLIDYDKHRFTVLMQAEADISAL